MATKKGATAMAHARAWAATRYPGALTLEAFPRIVWIPKEDGTRIPMSRSEDIFGCFDLLVFPRGPSDQGVQLVQVTTMHSNGTDANGTVANRKKKIATWWEAMDLNWPDWIGGIWLLGWVPRKHFRVWDYTGSLWVEGSPATAPLPKKQPVHRSEPPPPA